MSDIRAEIDVMGADEATQVVERLSRQLKGIASAIDRLTRGLDGLNLEGLEAHALQTEQAIKLLQEKEQALLEKGFHVRELHRLAQGMTGGGTLPLSAVWPTAKQTYLASPSQPYPNLSDLPKDLQGKVAKSQSQTETAINRMSPTAFNGPGNIGPGSRMLENLARDADSPVRAAQLTEGARFMAGQAQRVEAGRRASFHVDPARRALDYDLPDAWDRIAALRDGHPDARPGAARRSVANFFRRTERARREAELFGGPEVAEAITRPMEQVKPKLLQELDEGERSDAARRAVGDLRDHRQKIEKLERDADKLDEHGFDRLAAEFRKKARQESRKLPGLMSLADEATQAAPRSEEWGQWRKELVGHKTFTGERLKKEQDFIAGEERKDASGWAKGQIGRVQEKFDRIEDLKKFREERKAAGDDDAADRLAAEIRREAEGTRRLTDALERHARALLDSEDERDRKRGFELFDQLKAEGKGDEFRGMADKTMADYRDSELQSLGRILSKGLKDIPVIGEALRKLGADKTFADAIDKTPFGQAGSGALTGLMGGKLSKEEEDNPLTKAAHEAGTYGRVLAGRVLKHPLAWIVGGAAAGAYYVNKKTNEAVDQTADARNEEIIYGNLGNKLGTSDRLMNDVRETRGRDQNGALSREMLALRMGTEDYVNFLAKTDAPGLDTETRRRSAMTGLRIARAYGMDPGEVGGVAHEIARGDRTLNNGSLTRDLNQFALVLSEGIKRGVGSEETSRAFSSAIERSRVAGGGVLEEAQRAGLMNQLLAAQQSGNAHLLGQNGADFISGANERLAGAQGKDLAFLLRSVGDAKGADLGLNAKDAATYDELRQVSPVEAARFAQSKVTPQMQERQIRHLVGAYGDNVETLATGLRDVTGMDKGQAAEEALRIQNQLKDARKRYGLSAQEAWDKGLVHSDYLDALSGKAKPGAKDALTESQAGNNGYQTAGRQEIRVQDARIHAQRVLFEDEGFRRNVEAVQDFGQSKRNGAQGWHDFKNRFIYGNWRMRPDQDWGADEQGDPTLTGGKNYGVRSGEDSVVHGGRQVPSRTWDDKTIGIQAHAEGGHITGPGTEKSDSILARLSNGEFVVKGEETRKHRRLLEHINAGKLPAYANGGAVGNAPFLSGGEEGLRASRRVTEALERLTLALERREDPLGVQNLLKTPKAQEGPEGEEQKGFFARLMDGLRGGAARLFGGGASPVEAVTQVPGSGDGGIGFAGVGSDIGNRLAQTGVEGLGANWGEKIAGYCSKFVRQVTEKALNVSDGALSGKLFGATAIESGNLWKKRGLTLTPDQVKASGGYQAGDVLFQMSGSGGAGHTGIVSADGKYVIENSTRGKGGKQYTPIEKFGRVDQVGRLSLDTDGDLRGDGLPAQGMRTTSTAPRRGGRPATLTADKAASLQKHARALGVNPNDLAAVISFETGGTFSPNARNPKSSGTGLIQFMDAADGKRDGKYWGMTRDEFGGLSFDKQMGFVTQYMRQRGIGKNGKNSLADLYQAVAGSGYKRGSQAYELNRVWDSNGNGVIEKDEQTRNPAFQAHVRSYFPAPGGRAESSLLGGRAGSAVPAGTKGETITYRIEVSGGVKWDGKDDPALKAAARDKVVAQIRLSGQPRRGASGSARPG